MPAPRNCPEEVYSMMLSCWKTEPKERPSFKNLFNTLGELLKKSLKSELEDPASQQQVEEETSFYLS